MSLLAVAEEAAVAAGGLLRERFEAGVERVDDPQQRVVGSLAASLLTQDGVLGAPRGQHLADRGLRGEVGLGHEVGRRAL